jgi:hypothetical protein
MNRLYRNPSLLLVLAIFFLIASPSVSVAQQSHTAKLIEGAKKEGSLMVYVDQYRRHQAPFRRFYQKISVHQDRILQRGLGESVQPDSQRSARRQSFLRSRRCPWDRNTSASEGRIAPALCLARGQRLPAGIQGHQRLLGGLLRRL